jgi:hypothetical protein
VLQPGEQITEHSVPHSPFYVVVLKAYGMFAANGGQEKTFGPNTLLIFDPGEAHTVRALDEELVFIDFLQGVADMRPDCMRAKWPVCRSMKQLIEHSIRQRTIDQQTKGKNGAGCTTLVWWLKSTESILRIKAVSNLRARH